MIHLLLAMCYFAQYICRLSSLIFFFFVTTKTIKGSLIILKHRGTHDLSTTTIANALNILTSNNLKLTKFYFLFGFFSFFFVLFCLRLITFLILPLNFSLFHLFATYKFIHIPFFMVKY